MRGLKQISNWRAARAGGAGGAGRLEAAPAEPNFSSLPPQKYRLFQTECKKAERLEGLQPLQPLRRSSSADNPYRSRVQSKLKSTQNKPGVGGAAGLRGWRWWGWRLAGGAGRVQPPALGAGGWKEWRPLQQPLPGPAPPPSVCFMFSLKAGAIFGSAELDWSPSAFLAFWFIFIWFEGGNDNKFG